MNFIHLSTLHRATSYLGLVDTPNHVAKFEMAKDGMGLRVRIGELTILSGPSRGEKTQVLGVNQRASLWFPESLKIGPLRPYRFLVSPNPELGAYASVSPVGPVDSTTLPTSFLSVSAFRPMDLADFPWLFEILVIS